MKTIKDIPLRERKFAQTKYALLEATVEALKSKPLSELTVKEICDVVEISEGTFFNYFPKKTDIIVYYIQIWATEVLWNARKQTDNDTPLKIIESIFIQTGDKLLDGTSIMDEIISYMATMKEKMDFKVLTPAERWIALSEHGGVDEIPAEGLEDLFTPNLIIAVQKGELPVNCNIEAATVALWAIFFGVPLMMRLFNPSLITALYKQQLFLLWAGLWAKYNSNIIEPPILNVIPTEIENCRTVNSN